MDWTISGKGHPGYYGIDAPKWRRLAKKVSRRAERRHSRLLIAEQRQPRGQYDMAHMMVEFFLARENEENLQEHYLADAIPSQHPVAVWVREPRKRRKTFRAARLINPGRAYVAP